MSTGSYLTDHKAIVTLLQGVSSIALVGASANPERPSYEVMAYLLSRGYDVLPVNPGLAGGSILNQIVYGSLADIDKPVDMVDVFRKSNAVVGVLNEVLKMRKIPKIFWTQLGVFDEDAAEIAVRNGLTVVMDRCPKIELS
ncbi:CoA-binding protein [Bartonella sp. LJL80]